MMDTRVKPAYDAVHVVLLRIHALFLGASVIAARKFLCAGGGLADLALD
jgi:hypothetical protein